MEPTDAGKADAIRDAIAVLTVWADDSIDLPLVDILTDLALEGRLLDVLSGLVSVSGYLITQLAESYGTDEVAIVAMIRARMLPNG